MRKKAWIGAPLLCAPLLLIGLTGVGPAGGSVPVITANGTVTCTTLGGKISFSPALHNTGTSNTETATVHVSLKGCSRTSTNLPAGSIIKGVSTSKLVTTSTNDSANACAGLATSRASTQTAVWHDKNSAGVTLAKLTNSTTHFSGFDILTNGSSEPGFDLPQDSGGTASGSGSFAGTDAGASSEANVFGKKTIAQITAACGTTTGLVSLPVGGPGTAADPSHSHVG
jgi:hypothetical protein